MSYNLLKQNNILLSLIYLYTFLIIISCINTPCSTNSQCQNLYTNSYCGRYSKCVCNQYWVGQCNYFVGKIFNYGNTYSDYHVTQQAETYFIIMPHNLDRIQKYSIRIINYRQFPISIQLAIWHQKGFLYDLTTNNPLSINQSLLHPYGQITIQTKYRAFNVQPNGQSQYLILRLKTLQTNPLGYRFFVGITLSSRYYRNVMIQMIIPSILSQILVFSVIFLICYRCRKSHQQIQTILLQKQPKSILHFQKYMPCIPAQMIKLQLPLCSICLNFIKSSDIIRLTLCRHIFHSRCIDLWCQKQLCCPICKQLFNEQTCNKILPDGLNLNHLSVIKTPIMKYLEVNNSREENQQKNNGNDHYLNANINNDNDNNQKEIQIDMIQLSTNIKNKNHFYQNNKQKFVSVVNNNSIINKLKTNSKQLQNQQIQQQIIENISQKQSLKKPML